MHELIMKFFKAVCVFTTFENHLHNTCIFVFYIFIVLESCLHSQLIKLSMMSYLEQ